MRKKEVILRFFIASLLIAAISSCGKQPFACFKTDREENDIHVNQPVLFTSACSTNGNEYFWEFYGTADSVEFGPTVTKTFKDTGSVHVFLLVTNGNKSGSTARDIRVRP